MLAPDRFSQILGIIPHMSWSGGACTLLCHVLSMVRLRLLESMLLSRPRKGIVFIRIDCMYAYSG